MPTRIQKAIGAVKDRTTISLAIVNSSSNLDVAVVRATTHDDAPIDERYIYEVLQLVSSNKVYAAAAARAIGRRISRTRNWIVALKSLMLVLRIFQDGDPYFPREVLHAMKRGTKILNLSNFRDESHSSPWDYTAFVRTFALYLEDRLECFLTGKLRSRCTYKERDGSHSFKTIPNESVCDMKPSMLLDRIESWQQLLDRVIATRPTGSAKNNLLVKRALSNIVKESFDFYKDITDGLAVILDSFFDLQHEACVHAYEICVKAAKQFEELGAFYSLCQSLGFRRISEYPNVRMIPEELIETMQRFLKDQSVDKPLLIPGLGTRSPSSCDGGHPELDKRSEFGEQSSSIEDLISATETGNRPSISIDLEAYPDQFEKKLQREEPCRVSDTGSTRSLPVMNSTIDLLTLDDWDWPQVEERERRQEQRKQDLLDTMSLNDSDPLHSSSDKNVQQTSSGKGWELVLAESVGSLSRTRDNNLNDFQNPIIHDTYSGRQESVSKEGWELALAGMPTQQQTDSGILSNTFDASTAMTLYDQPQPQSAPSNHYNPFLDDIPVTQVANPPPTTDFRPNLPGNNPFSRQAESWTNTHTRNGHFPAALRRTQSDQFATAPHPSQNDPFMVRSLSIQNDPFTGSSHPSQNDSFTASSPSSSHGGQDKGFTSPAHSNQSDPFAAASHSDPNDPFASCSWKDDPYNETVNQQDLLKQQRLWLQHQQKIMARNMANV